MPLVAAAGTALFGSAAATAATIGTAASIGSSLIGASRQAKAAKQAAETVAQSEEQNRQLAKEQYDRTYAIQQPYVERGNYAGGMLDTMFMGGYAPRQIVGTPQGGYRVQNRGQAPQAPQAPSPAARSAPRVGEVRAMKDGAMAQWDGARFRRLDAPQSGGGGYSIGSNAVR